MCLENDLGPELEGEQQGHRSRLSSIVPLIWQAKARANRSSITQLEVYPSTRKPSRGGHGASPDHNAFSSRLFNEQTTNYIAINLM
jgi:hypothetical protein